MDEQTQKPLTAQQVGTRDMRQQGWANRVTSELFPGLVVHKGMKVVDIGCGNGGYTMFCARRGAEVTFIDRQENHVRELEDKLSKEDGIVFHGMVSDCDPIPLPDGYADLVICTEVLEHVRDPEIMLSELARIARYGASLLLTVPDSRGENLIKEVVAPDYFQEPNHIRIFTAEEFEALVCRHGLEVVRHDYRGAFWAIFYLFKWVTSEPGEVLNEDVHPITKLWTRTWSEVLDHPDGSKIVENLNRALPQSQIILARKKPLADQSQN